MNCTEASGLLALHVAGDLAEDEAARVEAHLDTCASCRAARDEIAGVVDLARRAFASVEPGAGFADAVAARLAAGAPACAGTPSAPGSRRRLALAGFAALAAAAAVLAAVLLPAAPEGRLLQGALACGATDVLPGKEYRAARECLLDLFGGMKTFVVDGTRFALQGGELALVEGSCVVAAAAGPPGQTRAVRVRDCVVEFSRADVYVHAGDDASAVPAAATFLGRLLPVCRAAGEDEPIVIAALAGTLRFTLPGRTRALDQGQAAFVTGPAGLGGIETVEIEPFLADAGTRLVARELGRAEVARELERYRAVAASYARDLVGKREALAAVDAAAGQEREELVCRIALVEELRTVHERRRDELAAQLAGDGHAQMRWRADRLHAARDGYGRALELLGPAGPRPR